MTVGRHHGRAKGAGLLLALACLAAMATEAAANTRVCSQLKAELASATAGGGSAQYKKYDAAVTRQREHLDIARRQARRASCGFSFLGGSGECGHLNAQIDRMERNLQQLERKRRQLAGNVNPRRDRARILAALDANGCRQQKRPNAVVVTRDQDSRSLFDQLFGGQVRKGLPAETAYPPLGEESGNIRRVLPSDGRITIGGPPGEFRTLCVRTCDGYFFPMSSSSSSLDFDRDQKNCEAACPGTEVRLYYHRANGETDAMVAAGSSEPYSALSSAYLYKRADYQRPPQCGCNPVKNFAIIAGEPPAPEPVAQEAAEQIPVPTTRPDAGADPETLADAEGGLTADAIARLLAPRTEKTAAIGGNDDGGDRRVRVVGPVFLPDPEGAIDLQAPGPRTSR